MMIENKKFFICITLVLNIILYGIFNPLYAGEAILSWTPPTTNTDGTPLTDLAGHKIYYGTSTGTYNSILGVGNVSTASVNNLTEKVTYYFTVTAYDSVGNESGYSNEVYKTIPDLTPPVISGVSSGTISTNAATISWTTNEPATSQVDYGTTTNYGSSTTIDSNLATNHSVLINGLSPTTVYHYRVMSKDAAGNIALSADYTLTTTTPPDTTAPTISSIASGTISTNAATISWTTNEPATSQVDYGTTTNYGSSTTIDTNLATNHSVLINGLSPTTVYHYRVMSKDAAGNIALSADYTLTTTTPPDTPPAPIMDLKISSGVSTRDSVFLDWTATGADGTEGTATSYDLRMSEFRIIEDGVSTNQGEINFSIAPKITEIIAPAIAGSAEVIKVNKLVPNIVYFFAIKATDEKGNISAISNVINGNNFPPLPVTALRNGYNMISIPLAPQTSDAQALLSGIVGSPVELFWWRSNGINDESGSYIAETNIVPGYGYLLKSSSDNAVINISGTVITDPSRSIPLQTGWDMIGNPYPIDIPLINTYIRKIDTGELKSYEDAVISGWVSNSIYTYNGSTYNFEMYSNASLRIWQGYWIAVLKTGQYEMVIYKP